MSTSLPYQDEHLSPHPSNDNIVAMWSRNKLEIWNLELGIKTPVSRPVYNLEKFEWTESGKGMWMFSFQNNMQLWSFPNQEIIFSKLLGKGVFVFSTIGEAAVVSSIYCKATIFTAKDMWFFPLDCLQPFVHKRTSLLQGKAIMFHKTHLTQGGQKLITSPKQVAVLNDDRFLLQNTGIIVDQCGVPLWHSQKDSIATWICRNLVVFESLSTLSVQHVDTGKVMLEVTVPVGQHCRLMPSPKLFEAQVNK
jgi:hypothetical protein